MSSTIWFCRGTGAPPTASISCSMFPTKNQSVLTWLNSRLPSMRHCSTDRPESKAFVRLGNSFSVKLSMRSSDRWLSTALSGGCFWCVFEMNTSWLSLHTKPFTNLQSSSACASCSRQKREWTNWRRLWKLQNNKGRDWTNVEWSWFLRRNLWRRRRPSEKWWMTKNDKTKFCKSSSNNAHCRSFWPLWRRAPKANDSFNTTEYA